ncbi:MAG: hypothetical protein BGO49_11080 [Planctomycetales bacterium 71-10]|nr:MAG: hypothetical protein BGO49_11080 [Planctomycetales bacterium 71-10]
MTNAHSDRCGRRAAIRLEALEGRWLLTGGVMRFGPPAPVALEGSPNSSVLADFNGDGKLDLASALGGSDVGVAPGNGDGTFQATRYFRADPDPFFPTTLAAVVGDFNNDGRPDLAISTFSTDAVSVLLNTSEGGGLSFAEPITHGAGAEPVFLAVGDFNRDGRLDVATANIAADAESSVGILLGRGDGRFEDLRFAAAGANPNSIAVGDFNRDGVPDLAVSYSADAGASADRVGVLLGRGDGTFQAVRYFAAGTTPASIAVGDFNRDGVPDLAAANVNSDNVSVLVGDGAGGFTPRATYRVGSKPNAIVAADFTGDGRLDLAVANSKGNSVTVLTGRGNGTFLGANSRRNVFPAGPEPSGSLAVGRIARRFLPDLVVPNASNRASVLLNRTRLPIHYR